MYLSQLEPNSLVSFEYDEKDRLVLVREVSFENSVFHIKGIDYLVDGQPGFRCFAENKVKNLTLLDKKVKEVSVSRVPVKALKFKDVHVIYKLDNTVTKDLGSGLQLTLDNENKAWRLLVGGQDINSVQYDDLVKYLK